MSMFEAEERLKRLVRLLCMANPSILKAIYSMGKSLPETQFGRNHLLLRIINIAGQALTRAYKHYVFDLEEAMERYKRIIDTYWKYYGSVVVGADTSDYIKFLDEIIAVLEENPRYTEWADKMWSSLQSIFREIYGG